MLPMKLQHSLALFLAGGSLFMAGQSGSQAVTVSIDPTSQNVGLGGVSLVDVKVGGLVNGAPPTLAGFDFTLLYNDAILNATGVSFGTGLGAAIIDTNAFLDLTTPGVFALQFTLEDYAALELAQGDSFTLFTIAFDAIGLGTSSITQDIPGSLSDPDAVEIPFQFSEGSVTVRPTGPPPNGDVPEPSTVVSVVAFGGLLTRFAWLRTRSARS